VKRQWCIPPREDAAFVAVTEDILEVSCRPLDPARPLVCFYEGRKDLRADVRAPLYAAFPHAEGRRLWTKLEVHPIPTHGSWLNMVEIELSALGRQCGVPPGPTGASATATRWSGRWRPG